MYHLIRISRNSVRAQAKQSVIQLLIVGRNRAAFSGCYGFDRMKTEGCKICDAAYFFIFILCADRMRRILDQHQIMLLADLTDLIQLHCLTGKIHRNDSFCLLRDMAADALRVDVVGVTLYISKYRRSAAIQNAVGGSSKRQGGYDYLIPFRNARRHRSQMQRRRSVADHNDIVCPGYFAQTLLQLCHLRSTGERIAAQHICNRFYVRIINILVPIGNRCLPNRLPAKNC